MSIEFVKYSGVTAYHEASDYEYMYRIGYQALDRSLVGKLGSFGADSDTMTIKPLTIPGCQTYVPLIPNELRASSGFDYWHLNKHNYSRSFRMTLNGVSELVMWNGSNQLFKLTPSGPVLILTILLTTGFGGIVTSSSGSNIREDIWITANCKMIHEYDTHVVFVLNLPKHGNMLATCMASTILRIPKSLIGPGSAVVTVNNNSSYIGSGFSGHMTVVYDDDTKVVMLCQPRSSDNNSVLSKELSLVTYNKATNTVVEASTTWNMGGTIKVPIGSSKVLTDTNGAKYVYLPKINEANTGFDIYKLVIDPTILGSTYDWEGKVSKVNINTSNGDFISDVMTNLATSTTYCRNVQCNLVSLTFDSTEYLAVFTTPVGTASLPYKAVKSSRISFYKYNPSIDLLEPRWTTNVDPLYQSFMLSEDGKTVLVSGTDRFCLYKLDPTGSTKYGEVVLTESIERIGFDSSQVIWIQTASGLSLRSESVNKDFMLEVLPSTNRFVSGPFPAESSIRVRVYNKAMTQVAQYVTLVAENAVFKDSASSSLRVLTSVSDLVEVKLNVLGSGQVKISATGF